MQNTNAAAQQGANMQQQTLDSDSAPESVAAEALIKFGFDENYETEFVSEL